MHGLAFDRLVVMFTTTTAHFTRLSNTLPVVCAYDVVQRCGLLDRLQLRSYLQSCRGVEIWPA